MNYFLIRVHKSDKLWSVIPVVAGKRMPELTTENLKIECPSSGYIEKNEEHGARWFFWVRVDNAVAITRNGAIRLVAQSEDYARI